MNDLMVIVVGIAAVGSLAMVLVLEFFWRLKDANFRWPLAIISFLFEMVIVGLAVYGLIRYCPTMF